MNQDRTLPEIPRAESHEKRIWWEMVSNAEEMSKRIKMQMKLESTAIRWLLTTLLFRCCEECENLTRSIHKNCSIVLKLNSNHFLKQLWEKWKMWNWSIICHVRRVNARVTVSVFYFLGFDSCGLCQHTNHVSIGATAAILNSWGITQMLCLSNVILVF